MTGCGGRLISLTYGNAPTEQQASAFIDKHIVENQIDLQEHIIIYQRDWDSIATEYQKRAEAVFGVTLPEDITVYLTINTRCPYDIGHNLFYVPVPTTSARKTVMHELWHFYTWYKFGNTQEEILGKQNYNDLKEALTILLNVECKDFLPEGVADKGYPQHKELREKILELWAMHRNIDALWDTFVD